MEEYGIKELGLHKIVISGLKLLDLITFYTIKGPETRAWLVKQEPKLQRQPAKSIRIWKEVLSEQKWFRLRP